MSYNFFETFVELTGSEGKVLINANTINALEEVSVIVNGDSYEETKIYILKGSVLVLESIDEIKSIINASVEAQIKRLQAEADKAMEERKARFEDTQEVIEE